MDQTLDWARLIDAIVESLGTMRLRPTEAAQKISNPAEGLTVSPGTVGRWIRGGPGSRGEPRGMVRATAIDYAARTWPDWRERFATGSPEGDDGRVKGADQGKKGRRQK